MEITLRQAKNVLNMFYYSVDKLKSVSDYDIYSIYNRIENYKNKYKEDCMMVDDDIEGMTVDECSLYFLCDQLHYTSSATVLNQWRHKFNAHKWNQVVDVLDRYCNLLYI